MASQTEILNERSLKVTKGQKIRRTGKLPDKFRGITVFKNIFLIQKGTKKSKRFRHLFLSLIINECPKKIENFKIEYNK